MINKVKLVMTEEQAIEEIRAFRREGFALDEIYVLAHDDNTTIALSDLMNTNRIGLDEEGVANSFANLFRSKGDELRSKMQSLGMTEAEADHFEPELDKGKILVMAWYDETDRYNREEAYRRSLRRDGETVVPPVYMYDPLGPGGGIR